MDPSFRLDNQPWQKEPPQADQIKEITYNSTYKQWEVLVRYMGARFHYIWFDSYDEALKFHEEKVAEINKQL